MNTTNETAAQPSRRAFLQTGLACGLLPSAGAFLRAETTADQGRILVLLHLSGGNDGLNTVIPYADPLYHELRPRLSSVAASALRIDSQTAFHPALSGLASMFKGGRLAVIQGVGCPIPDYSHRGSCQWWGGGGMDKDANGSRTAGGWWDRVLQGISNGDSQPAVAVGGKPLVNLVSPDLLRLAGGDTTRTRGPADYVQGGIERNLAGVMRVLRSSCPPRLVLATLGGFDTHSDQLARHDRVLRELDAALTGFHSELSAAGLADRVLVAGFSEFGRRPAENATGGTDHGYAGPVFVLGDNVRGGLYGRAPSLEATDFGNLIPTVHVQSVYELLATQWLACGTGTSSPAVQSTI
jgi:uncharacterized protein (DUF1501 family)